jgi:hydroxymethylglutaryl-CoA lyase
LVTYWAKKLNSLGIQDIALADTTGVSDINRIDSLFSTIIPELQDCRIIAHLHSLPHEVMAKTQAAYQAGCRNFDSALKGFGGCPMATDDLTGNMATEIIAVWAKENNIETSLNQEKLHKAMQKADSLFNAFH